MHKALQSPSPSYLFCLPRLHPNRYRTQLCKDTLACNRPVCFFAHSLAELRTPPPGLGLGGAIENDAETAWPSSLLNSAAALRGSESNLMKVASEPIARSMHLRNSPHPMMGSHGGGLANGFGNGLAADPSVLVSYILLPLLCIFSHPSHFPYLRSSSKLSSCLTKQCLWSPQPSLLPASACSLPAWPPSSPQWESLPCLILPSTLGW